MIFSANVTLLNFSFLENTVFCHSITYHLNSGSKWLTQFSYSKVPKILIEVHRETSKASDTYLLQWKGTRVEGYLSKHDNTQGRKNSWVCRKNHGYSLLDEKSDSCKLLAFWDNMEFRLLCWNISLNSQLHEFVPHDECQKCCSSITRWFKYDRDWFVCKQTALRSSCATLREWSHNLHPPSCLG